MHLFHYDPEAGIPAHVQLKEQVKVALALGSLRPGDLLPSIRKVEEDIGVGRMLVRKAYQQLQDIGLVRIIHGKGAVVSEQPRANGRLMVKADTIIRKLVASLSREGLDPVSFSRLLQQRLNAEDFRSPRVLYVDSSEVLARELGQQLQQAFGVRVRTTSVPLLRGQRQSISRETQVLVSYYYLEDVRRIIGRRTDRILPVSWDYDAVFVERLRSLPLGSSVLLLYYEASLREQGTRLAIDALLDRVKEREFKVDVKAVERVGRLGALARSRYDAIVVSNRVWDEHAAVLEKSPDRFWRLSSRVNPQSLEAVRDKLGFVL
jgi:DNA-binding transcriptional regulator YhcF (GntR family)